MSKQRIEEVFQSKKAPLFMPYLMGGYPTIQGSLEIGRSFIAGGADILELGVPFSDPLADGPTIQEAATTALANGVELADVLTIGKKLAADLPVVLMCYINMIFAHGVEQFVDDLVQANISGVIVPDLPVEEAGQLQAALDQAGLALISLVAPTTSLERLEKVLSSAQAFIYLVSVVGTTGERQGNQFVGLRALIDRVRSVSDLPIAVGFGVANEADVQAVSAAGADGVIVGSHFVRLVSENSDYQQVILARTRCLVAALRKSC